MVKNKCISVIIPAYNESQHISDLLKKIISFSWIDEILVVNDGSIDDTGKVSSCFPVKIINLPKNRGKGKAVETALKAVSGDVLLLLDADLKGELFSLIDLVKPVAGGKVEVTIAVLPVSGGGFGLVRKLADCGLYLLTGKRMKAPLSGQRVLARGVIPDLLPLAQGFGLEIVMDYMIITRKISYQEIKCNLKHRVTGMDAKGFLHRGKQFSDIFLKLIKLFLFRLLKNFERSR